MYEGDVSFDFDAMLMFGWVADPEMRVVRVSQSVRKWLHDNGHDSEPLQRLLRQVETPGVRLPLKDFLKVVLADDDAQAGDVMVGGLEELRRWVHAGCGELREPSSADVYSTKTSIEKTVDGDGLIAALRLVRIGGVQLRSPRLIDRVDLVGVCIVRQQNDFFRVVGFQGQLQEAWQRVEPAIKLGTQSGGIALMSRNLSHNIGSHALQWLKREEIAERHKTFYGYLAERMELIAGFATDIPLSFRRWNLRKVLDGFQENSGLLDNLCRTDGLTEIDLDIDCDDRLVVAIPGGMIGVHAIYSIIENTLRDSAKHGRGHSKGKLEMTIRCRETLSKGENVVRVTLVDKGSSSHAVETLRGRLEKIRIADESGTLVGESWGLKERLVCAALLRGIRFEDLNLADLNTLNIGCVRPGGGRRLVAIGSEDGYLTLSFCLLMPAEMLLITAAEGVDNMERGLTVRTPGWLAANLSEPSAVRHRFVVIAEREAQAACLQAPEKLPARVLVTFTPPHAPSNWMPIEGHLATAEALSAEALQQRWVERLLARRGIERMPTVCVALPDPTGSAGGAVELQAEPSLFQVQEGHNARYLEEFIRKHARDVRSPLVVFQRHTPAKPPVEETGVGGNVLMHFEPYQFEDAARTEIDAVLQTDDGWRRMRVLKLLEAALTRVLVVDERLDRIVDGVAERYDYTGPWRLLWAWKGVHFRGKEFGRQGAVPSPDDLRDWLVQLRPDLVVLHLGLADSLEEHHGVNAHTLRDMVLAEGAYQLVIHSGRMESTGLPSGVKFMGLSNLMSWVDRVHSKSQVVEEINQLRRV